MKKLSVLFLLMSMLASGAMAEKVDIKGKACGSVKGILNCASGCFEDGVRLTPDKCGNSFRRSAPHDAAPVRERGVAPRQQLYE